MNLELDETQRQLKAMARDFLKDKCPLAMVRQSLESGDGYSSELWRAMAGLGWLGMVYPAEYGGGASLLDMAVIYEEMGRALVPSPHLTSVVLSGLTICDAGNERQRASLLPALGSGEAIATLALEEPEYSWGDFEMSTTATREGDDFVLYGRKLFIPYAHVADYVLCVARTSNAGAPGEGGTLFLVDKTRVGLECRRLNGFLGMPVCEVFFDGVRVPASDVLGEVNRGWHYLTRAVQSGIVLQCCELVGGADYVLNLTIEYSRQRKQFGEFIGSFQRVQDRIIDMLNALDQARLMTYEAAWRLSEGLPAQLEVSLAKAVAGEAFTKICDQSHYVHAGIGFMSDYDLHLYTRKARTAVSFLGSPAAHRRIAAAELMKRDVFRGYAW